MALRKQNLSIYDIRRALAAEGHTLSPVAVSLILQAEGFARLPRRRDEERPPEARPEKAPVADVRCLDLAPRTLRTAFGGLFLFLPDLARLPLGQILEDAAFPGSQMIPAGPAMCSLLALKLYGNARHSHVMSTVLDEGLALFAGLNHIPKRSFDSKLTTHRNLHRLNQRGVAFLTLRRRDRKLLEEIRNEPPSAWRRIELPAVSRAYRTPRILDRKIALSDYEGPLRQITATDLGHEEPTLLLTNQLPTSPVKLVSRYAQRMLIENGIQDGVDFFHMDALSSAVAMKVNCDVQLTLMASSLYRLLGMRVGHGYETAKWCACRPASGSHEHPCPYPDATNKGSPWTWRSAEHA